MTPCRYRAPADRRPSASSSSYPHRFDRQSRTADPREPRSSIHRPRRPPRRTSEARATQGPNHPYRESQRVERHTHPGSSADGSGRTTGEAQGQLSGSRSSNPRANQRRRRSQNNATTTPEIYRHPARAIHRIAAAACEVPSSPGAIDRECDRNALPMPSELRGDRNRRPMRRLRRLRTELAAELISTNVCGCPRTSANRSCSKKGTAANGASTRSLAAIQHDHQMRRAVVESVTHALPALNRRVGRIERMTTSLALMLNIGPGVAVLFALCGVMLAPYRATRMPHAHDGPSAVGGDGPSRSDLSGERRHRTDGPLRTNHAGPATQRRRAPAAPPA